MTYDKHTLFQKVLRAAGVQLVDHNDIPIVDRPVIRPVSKLTELKTPAAKRIALNAPTESIQAIYESAAAAPAKIANSGSTSLKTAQNDYLPEALFLPGKGTFFKKEIDLREPEGSAFTTRVLELYDLANPRRRAWKAADLVTHAHRVRKLLANAMRGHFYRKRRAILYFKGAASKHYIHEPSWMKYGAIGDVVEGLEKAGLVRAITGKLMPWWSDKPSTASSYIATKELIGLAEECGVSALSLTTKFEPEWLVQLYERKPGPVYDYETDALKRARKGKPIALPPSQQVLEWIATLEAINRTYGEQDIKIGLTDEEIQQWLKKRNSDPKRSGAPYRLPETYQADVYRVFNDGDKANPAFDYGGRLYGGWWMSVPEDLRKAITINGQQTVELDFKNCHPRMLYNERGIEPEGDLYIVPELAAYEEATSVKPGTYRPYVKWLMQVLINGGGRPQSAEMPCDIITPPDFTIEQVIGFIEEMHKPIADAFQSRAGLRLMRVESDIALEIISTAMAEGWTVLTVHDSCICTIDNRERMEALMIEAYSKRFKGIKPVIY